MKWQQTPLETHQKRSLVIFFIIFLLFLAGLATTSYLTYQNYETKFRAQAEQQLSSIAELKVNELIDWRKERMANAEVLHHNPALTQLTHQYFEDPTNVEVQTELQAWLDSYQAYEEYDRIRLVDPQGVTRLSSPPDLLPVSAAVAQHIPEVIQTPQVLLLDFYRRDDQSIFLGLLIPIVDLHAGNQVLGLIAFSINPTTYLYPFIQNWPVPSTSAETLLIRREGENALFLNPLRFQPDAALNLSSSLEESDLPAVKAVLGQTGVIEGTDYRGVHVVADLRAVPDSPWFLTTKMDTAEIYAPLRARLSQTVLLFIALSLAAGASLLLVWRQQRVRFYKSQVETLEALRVSEERFHRMFENHEAVMLLIEPLSGEIVDANAAAEKFYGHPMETLRQMFIHQINSLPPDEIAQERLRALHEERNYFIFPHRLASGDLRTVEVHSSPITFQQKTLLFSIIHDITARRQAEQQLAQYSEHLEELVAARTHELHEAQAQLIRQERLAVLGQLAGSVGHELRNPLGVISNAIYFLKLIQPDANEKVKEYLNLIENEVRISDKIVGDLLDFTRIKSVEREPTPVAELFRLVLARYPAPDTVEVSVTVPPDLPPLFVDPRQIVQVLGNLVVNAYQAIPNHGQMSLSSAWQNDMICISVQDSGTGIPPEHLKKLFEPLFTTKTKGIGLGLAVSKKLVEANQGRIEVQSEPGKGSTFMIYIPPYKEAA